MARGLGRLVIAAEQLRHVALTTSVSPDTAGDDIARWTEFTTHLLDLHRLARSMMHTMGQLMFGAEAQFELDDRSLAHIETVVLAKLRRNEGFALTLDEPAGGQSTLWIHASSVLSFRYAGERPAINRAWLDVLIDAANTPAGMRLLPEPTP